ncbi:MAG: ATP-binding protein [Polyangiaceae bacterium]
MSLAFRLKLFALVAALFIFPFVVVDLLASGDQPPRAFTPVGVLVAVALSALAATMVARWIGREVSALTDTARRMAAGDLAVRTSVEGSDDVAELGAALDHLATSLSSAMADLRAERDLVSGILDGMQEGVLLLGAAGQVQLMNPTLRDMLMVSNDIVGRSFIDAVRQAPLLDLLDAARNTQKPRSGEIELGGLRPRRLLVRAAPLARARGALLVVFVDVTDLRRLESMRRDFVANVSHELRTPVTAVLSATETLGAGAIREPEAAAKFIDIIERNTKRLRSLIDDLLDLSRIEAKEWKLAPERVDTLLALQHVVSIVRERAERQRVEVSIDVDPAVHSVVTDRRALDQILVNLTENAVKYCPGARVTLRAAPRGGEGPPAGVSISVSDTGPGIEDKHLSRIFERFYRVDPGRSRELGGTGLGLSIVKHLAEALGGAVTVTSVVGQGTTFTLDLPAHATAASPAAT